MCLSHVTASACMLNVDASSLGSDRLRTPCMVQDAQCTWHQHSRGLPEQVGASVELLLQGTNTPAGDEPGTFAPPGGAPTARLHWLHALASAAPPTSLTVQAQHHSRACA